MKSKGSNCMSEPAEIRASLYSPIGFLPDADSEC
jgi:hypothetical protein